MIQNLVLYGNMRPVYFKQQDSLLFSATDRIYLPERSANMSGEQAIYDGVGGRV